MVLFSFFFFGVFFESFQIIYLCIYLYLVHHIIKQTLFNKMTKYILFFSMFIFLILE